MASTSASTSSSEKEEDPSEEDPSEEDASSSSSIFRRDVVNLPPDPAMRLAVDPPARRMIASSAPDPDLPGVRIDDGGGEGAGAIGSVVVCSGADARSTGFVSSVVVFASVSAALSGGRVSSFGGSSGRDRVTLVVGSSALAASPSRGTSSAATSSGTDSIWKKSSAPWHSLHTNVSRSTLPSLYMTWSSSKEIGPCCTTTPFWYASTWR